VRAGITTRRAPLAAVAALLLVLALAAACGNARAAVAPAKQTMRSFISAPNLAPPIITIRHPGTLSPGYVFVAPIQIGFKSTWAGPVILDTTGQPVWMFHTPPGQLAMNFRVQTYQGQPVLTWWQGTLSKLGIGSGVDVIVNSAYKTVATVRAGNGFTADLHEFLIAPDGTAWITAYKSMPKDLTQYGGPRNGMVWDSVVQQIDITSGKVLFQWDPMQHLSLTESLVSPTKGVWDPFHVNSIDVNAAGDVLISARDTWAVYKVDGTTGAVLWRLGGRQSDFTLGAGVHFAYQHDARFRTADTISLFDNEGAPFVGLRSRGLVIKLDAASHTATLDRQYTHPGWLAGSQGNLQFLPGGGVFVGWGQEPGFTGFSATGQMVLDGTYAPHYESYRAFLMPWTGTPGGAPAVAVSSTSAGATVYASWNGATEVASWRVLAGADANHLQQVATGKRTGFETAVDVTAQGPVFQVQALDAAGNVLATSAAVK
jgi:hypothetical protein